MGYLSERSETAESLRIGEQEIEPLGMGNIAIRSVREITGDTFNETDLHVVVILRTTEHARFFGGKFDDKGQPECEARTPIYITWETYAKRKISDDIASYQKVDCSLSQLNPKEQVKTSLAMIALQEELQTYGVDLELDDSSSPIPLSGQVVLSPHSSGIVPEI